MKIFGKDYDKNEIGVAIVLFGFALGPVFPIIGGLCMVVAILAVLIVFLGALGNP